MLHRRSKSRVKRRGVYTPIDKGESIFMYVRQWPHKERPRIEINFFDTNGDQVFSESTELQADIPERFFDCIAMQAINKAKWFAEGVAWRRSQPWLQAHRI